MRLFHSSCFDLDIIHPSINYTATGEQGTFVFAQGDVSIASAYALKSPNVLSVGMLNGTPYLIAQNKSEFTSSLPCIDGKHGGYIYEVPSDSFFKIGDEYVSLTAVTPLAREFVSIEDAVKRGLRVLFFEKMPSLEMLKLALTSQQSSQEPSVQQHTIQRVPSIVRHMAP